MKIEILKTKDLDSKQWNKFVKESFNGSVFNTVEWIRVWESKGSEGIFFVLYEDGEIKAGLPVVMVKKMGLKNYYSMPYGTYGGLLIKRKPETFGEVGDLSEDEARKEEIISMFLKFAGNKFGIIGLSDFYNELASFGLWQLGFNKLTYKTQLLELFPNENILWNKKLASSTRLKVKQAQKHGVEVDFIKSKFEITDCYNLFKDTALRHKEKGPAFPLEFYNKLFDEMGSILRWSIARKGRDILASTVHFIFGDTIFSWASASGSTVLSYRPNNAIIWDTIKWGCNNGYKYYNFGGSPADAKGLYNFKEGWGAREKEYYFYYKESSKFRAFSKLRDIFSNNCL